MTLVTIVHHDTTQLTPLIFALKEEVHQHILVCDTARADKKIADELERGLRDIALRYGLKQSIARFDIDEDNPDAIEKVAETIAQSETPILNAAGADMTMTVMLAHAVFKAGGFLAAYDARDNTYNLLDGSTLPKNRTVYQNMGIEDFFTIHAERIEQMGEKRYTRELRKQLNTLFGLGKRLHELMQALNHKNYKKLYDFYWVFPALEAVGVLRKGRILSSYQSGIWGLWLEMFLFLKMEGFDFDDIAYNIVVSFEYDSKSNQSENTVSNEFDIVCIKDNHPGFVECKIGRKAIKPLETVYKVDALMDYFGPHSKGLIYNLDTKLSISHPVIQPIFSARLQYRARSKRIEILQLAAFYDALFAETMFKLFGARRRHWYVNRKILHLEKILSLLKHCGQKYTLLNNSDSLPQASLHDHIFALGLEVESVGEQPVTTVEPSPEKIARMLDCCYLLE